MNDTYNLMLGLLVGSTLVSLPQIFVDLLLRKVHVYMSDIAYMVFVPSLFVALAWEWMLPATYTFASAFEFIAITYLAVAYLTLPGLVMRRVERFDNILQKKRMAITSKIARKRVLMVLPFIINPVALFLVVRLILTRENLVYGDNTVDESVNTDDEDEEDYGVAFRKFVTIKRKFLVNPITGDYD